MTYKIPNTQAVSPVTAIGSTSDTITVSGLDLNVAGAYRIEFDLIMNNMADYANVFGYVNGDTTQTNYTTVRIQLANGGQGFYTSNDCFMTAADSCTAAKLVVFISRDALGNVKIWKENDSIAGGSTLFGDIAYINYNMGGVANVTSFSLVADNADAFLAQSTYRVFTEMAAPFVGYSSALLHFDGSDASTTITESSIWAKTWTASGDAELDTAQKVFGTASLKLTTVGAVSTPDHPSFAIGTGDFTWDARIRVPAIPTGGNSFAIMQKGNLSWGLSATTMDVTIGAGPTVISQTWSPTVDTWYAISVSRVNGVIRMFVDGVQLGGDTANTENGTTAQDLYIGDVGGGGAPFVGWIDEFRFIRVGYYSANYTPATSEFTS